jgi:hypothetical protein
MWKEHGVVGVVVAGRICGGCGQMTCRDLIRQLGLDSNVVDWVGSVRGRDRDLFHETAAPDGLVCPVFVVVVDDVGIVLGQPVHIWAVQHRLIEGGHARRRGVEDLRQVLAVSTAGGACAPQHLDYVQVGDDPPAEIRQMSAGRRRRIDGSVRPLRHHVRPWHPKLWIGIGAGRKEYCRHQNQRCL